MASGSNTFGGTVKLSGETEYRKALSNISAQLKVVSTDMSKVTAEFGKNDNSIESNAKKSALLNERLEIQKNKVETLRQALEKSKEMYGENDTRTLKWQSSLNSAEADVIKTTKEIDSLGNEVQDSGKQAEEASKGGYTVFKNVLANLATDVIESAVAGIKKLGGAMIDVGKQALNNYGDFQQLEGGVKTLFGTEIETVEEYAKSVGKSVDEVRDEYNNLLTAQQNVFRDANNAYKDAGMSANEYMETVTSFSASLISSLNGDRVAASEASKQAITDMADNANKMGSSLDSIKNAYQGFAKQNYTMLDNLKLGYGGTKTEMERLLSDAQKITGVKYDIKNLNDVYSAIHVIQTEMGITGTTQREASQTITGSIASMKSAYDNFLTGLANGNADMGQLITNLVDSVITAGDNILPVVDQIASSVMEVLPELLNNIIEHLPQFLEAGTNILNSLISGIQNNLPAIMNAVMQIVTTLVNTLIQNLPQILQMGIQIIVSLIQGIAQELPTLIPQIINAVILMAETLIDNIDLIIDAGIQLIIGLADGLIKALPDLIDKIPIIIDKLITAITDNLPKLVEMGITLIVKLAEGLIKAIPQLVSKIPQIIASLVKGITNYFGKMLDMGKQLLGKVKDGITNGISGMLDVGKNLVQGLWNGINNAKNWVLDKIKGFGKSILNGIKGIFGIHSPSTVFRDEIGKNLALGLGEGFEDEMQDVNKEMQKVLPTDFDLSSNINVSKNMSSDLDTIQRTTDSPSIFDNTSMVEAFKEALEGMAFKVDGEKMGELVIKDVERVIYS